MLPATPDSGQAYGRNDNEDRLAAESGSPDCLSMIVDGTGASLIHALIQLDLRDASA
jgi:hypothetical protein